MRARYRGWCKPGDHPVVPGDEVSRYARVGWAHPNCQRGPDQWARLNATEGRQAADAWDEMEAAAERREREHDDREYALGVADAERYRFNRDFMGQAWADAEEYARDMRGLNGDW